MKSRIKNLCLAGFVALLFGSCDNAVNNALTNNHAYIKDAYEKKEFDVYTEGTDEQIFTVPVNITHRNNSQDIQVSVGISQEALDAYNKRHGRNYKLYPTDLWHFDPPKVTIKSGTTGVGAKLVVKPLTPEMAHTGESYVIPVTLTGADGGVEILKGSEMLIYKLRRTPITTVLSFPTTTARALHVALPHSATAENPLRLTAYTVEFLWKTLTRTPRPNNSDPSLFWTISWDGDGFIFSRIGVGTGNQWDIATFSHEMHGGDITGSPPGGIVTNRWYHLAYTFSNGRTHVFVDGQLVRSGDVTATEVQFFDGFAARFASCNNDAGTNMRNHTMVSEFRFWEIERTPEELREYMYGVNPQSPGLICYWKFNEGVGNKLYDAKNGTEGYAFVGNAGWKNPASEDFQWAENENISIGIR